MKETVIELVRKIGAPEAEADTLFTTHTIY